ncbi:MAG TPA: nuclear transport factor 2 family protein [Pyrinomonadaceae bacterium]|nr:nuclear transport factor 2 family protein [Pyrinomonadaceae bacterium]
MKPISAIVFVFVLSFAASAQYKKGSVEDKLIEMDKAWTHAELTGDKKAAGNVVADDYVGTTQRGEIENKTQYLAGVTPNSDMVKADDYKVTIYGNTAVMTHRSTVSGVRNIQFRSTHIWMKRKGKWQIVAHHGSMIAPQDKDDQ